MKKRGLSLIGVLLAAAVLAGAGGCGSFDAPIQAEDLMEGIVANHPEEITGSQPDGTFARSTTDFSVQLFQQVYQGTEQTENTLLSPLSVLMALAMTANGAKGETLAQMEEVLGGGLSIEELNGYLYALLKSDSNTETVSLTYANSIWFRDDKDRFTPNQDFLQKNADYYGAALYKAPFDSQTVKDINRWVKESTDGEIPRVMEEIPEDAVMYLINTLLFDAEWRTVYHQDEIQKSKFTAGDGTEQTVEMMASTESIYLEDPLTTGFVKPYAGGKYSFVALLPKETISLKEYVDSISGASLQALLKNQKHARVHTQMPKFEYGYEISLEESLSGMGMKNAFSGDIADFSGLGTSSRGTIFINRVLHKTHITVDAKGTKAGAATVIEMTDGMAPVEQEYYTVHLDRPFVYLIWDNDAGIPIFLGTVSKI